MSKIKSLFNREDNDKLYYISVEEVHSSPNEALQEELAIITQYPSEPQLEKL
jgi:hypothetical protein